MALILAFPGYCPCVFVADTYGAAAAPEAATRKLY
jgi:hypothetical protein